MSLPEYVKHLPYTTFVASAAYYTEIFTVEFWKKQSAGLTFRAYVEESLPILVPAAARRGIIHVAEAVDNLERSLRSNNIRRQDFGLGATPPCHITKHTANNVRIYFVTLLLDRLVWAWMYDGSQLTITLREHPDHQAPTIPRASGAKSMVDIPPNVLDKLIQSAILSAELVGSKPASWHEEPLVIATIMDVDDPQQLSPEVEPPDEEIKDRMVRTATVMSAGLQARQCSNLGKIGSNVCALAMSCLFLVADGVHSDFLDQFNTALPNVASSQSMLSAMREAWSALQRKKHGDRIGLATRSAMSALVGSPLFVLNTELDLLLYRGLNSNSLRFNDLIARAFAAPPTKNSHHLLAEAEVWKATCLWIGSVAVPTDRDGVIRPPPSFHDITNLISAVSTSLSSDCTPLIVRTAPWEHASSLYYRILQEEERQTESQVLSHSPPFPLIPTEKTSGPAKTAQSLGDLPSEHGLERRELLDSVEPSVTELALSGASLVTDASAGSGVPRREKRHRAKSQDCDSPSYSKRARVEQNIDEDNNMSLESTTGYSLRPRGAKEKGAIVGPSQSTESDKEEEEVTKNTVSTRVKSSKSTNTSYVVVNSDYRDWPEEAAQRPDFLEIPTNVKPNHKQDQDVTDVLYWNVMLTKKGRLLPEPREYHVTWPGGTSEDRRMFKELMESAVAPSLYNGSIPGGTNPWPSGKDLPGGDVFPRAFIETVMDPVAPAEWVDCIRKLLATRPVHIPSRRRKAIPAHWDSTRVLSLEQLEGTLGVNTNLEREVHRLSGRDENSPNAHIGRSSIRRIIGPKVYPAMNFLDIPSPASVTEPDFLAAISLNSMAGQLPMPFGFPQYSTKWSLLATAPAFSRAHYDAAKFATWVHVRYGAKIWAVLTEDPPEGPISAMGMGEYRWKYFLLEEDDILIMPPGTVHVVLTVVDCFASGGHFYAKDSLTLSLGVGLREHLRGKSDTNTQHVNAEFILHNLVQNYEAEIRARDINADVATTYAYVMERWPALEQLAALLVMVGHAWCFEPQKLTREGFCCTQELLDLRVVTRKRIGRIVEYCPALYPLIKAQEAKIRAAFKCTRRGRRLSPLVRRPRRDRASCPSESEDKIEDTSSHSDLDVEVEIGPDGELDESTV